MSVIAPIIAKYRGKMETAGLVRPMGQAQALSPALQQMRTSSMQARRALMERQQVNIQPSPLSSLFEITIPALEPTLIELGQERAEQIIGLLCDHSREMIQQHGVEGAKFHLEELFNVLPNFEAQLRKEGGIDQIVGAYYQLNFENCSQKYLQLTLGEAYWINDSSWPFVRLREFVTDSQLAFLSRAHDLVYLDLTSCTQVTDAGLAYLADLPNLKSLFLFGCSNITDTGLSYLAKLSNLEILSLGFCRKFTDEGLASLVKLSKLKDLNLEGCRQIIDQWLVQLARIASIETLNLAACHKITDAGLLNLKPLKDLRELFLTGSQETQFGIEELQRALSRLQIIKNH